MNIWTSKRVLLGAALLLGLAACSETATGFFSAEQGARPNTALTRTDMMRGALTLVPPDGYCVDRRGLRADFAILARCDSLGAPGDTGDAPLGLLTVSVSPLSGELPATADRSLPGPDTATLARRIEGGLTILHLNGATPPGTDSRHWKGIASTGGYAVAVSAYGPPGGQLARDAGATLIASLVARLDVVPKGAAEAPARPNSPGGFLSGLFD